MKTYGRKQGSKVCQCIQCGTWSKESTRKGSERSKAKKDIRDLVNKLSTSNISYSRKEIMAAAKKASKK